MRWRNLIVHNLEDDVRGLKDLADQHGRSVEEEAREILRGAVFGTRGAGQGNGAGKLGSRIAARFSAAGGLEANIPEIRGQAAMPLTCRDDDS